MSMEVEMSPAARGPIAQQPSPGGRQDQADRETTYLYPQELPPSIERPPMRKPWLMELHRDGNTKSRFFTTKREADVEVRFALEVEEFESAELFRRSDRKSVAKYLVVDGEVQNIALRTRYPLRAIAKLDKRQFSQIVDRRLMELGFTARQARVARRAIVELCVKELKQGREES